MNSCLHSHRIFLNHEKFIQNYNSIDFVEIFVFANAVVLLFLLFCYTASLPCKVMAAEAGDYVYIIDILLGMSEGGKLFVMY